MNIHFSGCVCLFLCEYTGGVRNIFDILLTCAFVSFSVLLFFSLYPEIWPSGLGLVPLLSFLKISLINCFHIVFRMALASKSLSVFSPCVLSSKFVTDSSQTPPLGTNIQLTSNNAPSHSPCIAIGTSKLITHSLILTHHCPIFLPRYPSGARMGWGGVALRVG